MTPQHPAAPETETDAREPFLIASLRRNPSGDIRHNPVGRGALGTSARGFLAELDAYVAERVRVVEGERDAARAEAVSWSIKAGRLSARAESAEAAHEAARELCHEQTTRAESANLAHEAEKAAHERLRAGVQALANESGGSLTAGAAQIRRELRVLLGGVIR